jgi:hypothetical protein
MSEKEIHDAVLRLEQLGVDTSDIYQDYYKIPLENIDLQKIEKKEPKNEKKISKHTVIIDSRNRNYSIYPNPNKYLIELMEPHRNVERIELIAVMLPKTEYNINSDNNLLLVTINGIQEELYLNQGQYVIGSNVLGSPNYITNGTPVVSGLLAELKYTLNKHTQSNSSFNVFLATLPNVQNGTGLHASVLNRIVITCNYDFSIDFTNTNYLSSSPYHVLGFNCAVYNSGNAVIYGHDNLGSCSSVEFENGTKHTITIPSLSGDYDYDLMDDPKYTIMELEFGNRSANRIESTDISSNQKFAVIIYDANEPDNIETYNSSTTFVQAAVSRRPGRLKALKGSDFDKKIITFDPPITLENFKITFYKYDNSLYDFHNRDHMLSFELDVADFDPKYRY